MKHDVYCDECGEQIMQDDYESCEKCSKILCEDEVCITHHFCEMAEGNSSFASHEYRSRIPIGVKKRLKEN